MLSDKEYNGKLKEYGTHYSSLNHYVMSHTVEKCGTDPDLIKAIEETKEKQYIVFDEDQQYAKKDGPTTNIILSKKRSFEAAQAYKGKKVAVLNFANNHSIGGDPFYSGAQEESLCRCSTLYPCLCKEKESFYDYHQKLFDKHVINFYGNDDLIYSPNVVVFKTDESAPKMMDKKDWYKVDVITCAAPQMPRSGYGGFDFDWGMGGGLRRLRKVFEAAKTEGVEVLILGAWGCGAFHNPPAAVASTFKILCKEYHFETVEFAVFCRDYDSENYDVFKEIFDR